MDVRFYNYEHELKAIAAHRVSVNWVLEERAVGTFEMHLSPRDAVVKTLMNEDYLIAVQGSKAAVIVSKTIDKSECVIYGRTLNYLLEKRVVLPFEESTEALWDYIATKFMPEYMSAQFDFTDCSYSFEKTARESVGSILSELCEDKDFGYEVLFHAANYVGNCFTLRIYEEKEKGVVISEGMRTGTGASLTCDALNYATGGYYNLTDDEGESSWEYITKDEDKSGIYKCDAILDSTTLSEAEAELEKLKWEKYALAQVRKLKFGEDYNLGDIVTVQIAEGDFKKSTKYRVSEVHLWEEGAEEGEEPTFEEV